jgi:hypothetical protein
VAFVVVAVVVVDVDSPKENRQSSHKRLKIVVTVVLGVGLEPHIPENLFFVFVLFQVRKNK